MKRHVRSSSVLLRQYGLDAAALARAADLIHALAPGRQCVLVVKRGEIVFERSRARALQARIFGAIRAPNQAPVCSLG